MRIAERGIEGIDLFADVRRLIQRLAVGVGGGELEPAAGVARAQFERVVVGVADVDCSALLPKFGPSGPRVPFTCPPPIGIVHRVFAARRRR